jgi:hypothetical protein
MAGVASPMLRQSRSEGIRFLVGLAVGNVIGAVLLALPVYLVGMLVHVVPRPVSLAMFVAACVGLGVADLRRRTPHVWRQVPQWLWHRLSPGWLGVAWGIDLGLLVTTQKTTSLIWVSLVAVVFLQPSAAVVVLPAIAVVASLVAVAGTLIPGAEGRTGVRWSGPWVVKARRGSGLIILLVAVAAAAQAWLAA